MLICDSDALINVGWGSKETQFHGSIGRAHLRANKDQVNGDSEGPLPMDGHV